MHARSILIWMVIAFSATSLMSQELLLPVKSNGKWGYCDTTGHLRISLQFDLAGLFNPNGLAPVKMGGSSYLINRKGEVITKDQCKEILVLGAGLYACYDGRGWKLYGPDYTSTLPYEIKAIENIGDAWAIYTPKGAGMLDSKGKLILEPQYDIITQAGAYGYFLIHKDSLVGVADINGTVILPVQYLFTDFKNLGIIVYNAQEKLGITSLNGKIKTDTIFDNVATNKLDPFVILYEEAQTTAYSTLTGKKFVCDSSVSVNFFDENYLMVYLPDGINLLDKNMNPLFKEQYHTIRREQHGFVVSKNNLFGYCDTTGTLIHPLRFSFISKIIEGTAIVGSGTQKGIIHERGSVIGEPIYDKAEVFSLTAKMYLDDKVTTVEFDERGRQIDKATYTNFMTISLGGFRDSRKPTQSSVNALPSVWFFYPETRKWGLNSSDGKILLPPMFDRVLMLDSQYTKVAIRNPGSLVMEDLTLVTEFKWGLVNHLSGEILYKPSYVDIKKDSAESTLVLIDHQMSHFIKDRNSKQLFGPFSWIGEPYKNVRPVAVGGKWINCGTDTTYRMIGKFNEYLITNFSSNTFLNQSWKKKQGDIALINAKYYCLWDMQVQKELPSKFDYISNFINGFARIGTAENTFGVINTQADTVVAPQYHHVEIQKSGNTVFFLKYKKREAYGFIKKNGAWAFEKKFDNNGFFRDGMAYMGKNDRGASVFVDTVGNVKEIGNVSRNGHFSEGLVTIRQNRKWFYADRNLNSVLQENDWNWIGDFKNGLAPVRVKNEYHYINEYGTPAFPTRFEKAEPFKEYGALVKHNGNWGMISTNGEYIIKPRYDRIVYKPADTLFYGYKNGEITVIKPNGEPLIKRKLQYLKSFVNGYAMASLTNGNHILLRKDGTYLNPPKQTRLQSVQGEFLTIIPPSGRLKLANTTFDTIDIRKNSIMNTKKVLRYRYGQDGVIFGFVQKTGWVAIDLNGTVLYELWGNPISGFTEGYAIVQMADGRKTYINKKGEQAFGTFFTYAEPFKNGYARVATQKGWGMVDVSGTFIVVPKYKYIGPFNEGYATVKIECLISLSNDKDIPLVDGEYDAVILEPIGFFRIESADRVGWISKQGKVIWNPAN